MSNVKYCPSCGTSLSISAAFCSNCGKKQSSTVNESNNVNKENLADVDQLIQEELNYSTEIKSELSATEDVHNKPEELTESTEAEELTNTTELSEAAEITTEADSAEVPKINDQTMIDKSLEATKPDAPELSTPQSQPVPDHSVQTLQSQSQPLQQSEETKKSGKTKKKFPVFFTIVWIVLLASVVAWGFYFYSLYNAGGDFPQFNEDAQRIVLYISSIFILIYTLSLKLSMKKLRAIPTVLLVIACIAVFYFFCMVELTDGDWLHDFVSNITEKILPASRFN